MLEFFKTHRKARKAQKRNAETEYREKDFAVDCNSVVAMPEIHCSRNRHRMPALSMGQGVDVTSPVCRQCSVTFDNVAVPEVHPLRGAMRS